MPKFNFIPHADHDFLIWLEHFIANLTPDLISAADLAALKADSQLFRRTIYHIDRGGSFSQTCYG